MKRSAEGVAPLLLLGLLQFGRCDVAVVVEERRRRSCCCLRETSGYWTGWFELLIVVVLLCAACSGCHAGQSLRLLTDDPVFNETLAANNMCLKNLAEEEQYIYYGLNISSCFDDVSYAYLSVEAQIVSGCNTSQEWTLLVNTDGEAPTIENSQDQGSNTYIDTTVPEQQSDYALLNLPLGGNATSTWVVGVHSSCGPVQYNVKAWCSVSIGCNLSCSDPDSGPCVSLETCRCIKEPDQSTCEIDVEVLPAENDTVTRDGLSISHVEELLRYGSWKYFQFQVLTVAIRYYPLPLQKYSLASYLIVSGRHFSAFFRDLQPRLNWSELAISKKVLQNDSRILVEMTRASGDVCLFLKPQGDSWLDSFPTEADADKYADLASFQNRLSHHYRYAGGAGIYNIGVFNTDHCVQEDTTYNLSVTISTPNNILKLCPLNCSYPQGKCVRENHCECEKGFGGNYCDASLWRAAPRKSFSGQLQPGEWAYLNLLQSELTEPGDVAIKYTADEGHSILLAQRSGYPTLKDFYVKWTDDKLSATPSSTYYINKDSLDDTNVIVAVFNVDYDKQGVSYFNIEVLGIIKGLSIWIILVVAVASSMVVLLAMGTFRYILQQRGEDGVEEEGLDFEAMPQPQGTEMVEMPGLNRGLASTLPLLVYQEGLLPREEAGCSICLNNYHIAELLCRLPACKHVFHVKCVDAWFQTNTSCPLCREDSHLTVQGTSQTPVQHALDLQSPTPGSSVAQQASSSSSQYEDCGEDIAAPLSTEDYQPLLQCSSSSESTSRSDSESSPLHGKRTRIKVNRNMQPPDL